MSLIGLNFYCIVKGKDNIMKTRQAALAAFVASSLTQASQSLGEMKHHTNVPRVLSNSSSGTLVPSCHSKPGFSPLLCMVCRTQQPMWFLSSRFVCCVAGCHNKCIYVGGDVEWDLALVVPFLEHKQGRLYSVVAFQPIYVTRMNITPSNEVYLLNDRSFIVRLKQQRAKSKRLSAKKIQ